MRRINRLLIGVMLVLPLLLTGVSVVRGGEDRSTVSAPRAQLVDGWNTLMTSPTGITGEHTGYGKWKFLDYDGYTCNNGTGCYRPYHTRNRAHSDFWRVGYDDSGWDDSTYVKHGHPWDTLLLPELGEYIVRADQDHPNLCTNLHRRWFNVPASGPTSEITQARVKTFSDNNAVWWINGNQQVVNADKHLIVPLSDLNEGGSNLLAVEFSNDRQATSNPMGIQYIIEVYVETYSLSVNAVDSDGNAVTVDDVAVARREIVMTWSYWVDISSCSACSSHTEDSDLTPGSLGIGGYVNPSSDQVILGVTPGPSGGTETSNGGYYWSSIDGDYTVDVVVATKTPTPTPTPYLEMSAVDAEGTPVQVAGLISGGRIVNSATFNDYETDVSSLDSAFGSAWDHYDTWGGVAALYSDQVLMGLNHSSGGGDCSYIGYDGYEWSPWPTGRKYVEFVVATVTPTPTPEPGVIQGHVFRDDDGDGTQDAGEPGLPDIYVNVVGGLQGTTDSFGEVSFSERPGDYTVEVDDSDNDLPPGSVLTTARSQSVSLASGTTEHIYFGFQPQGTIQEIVYLDENRNGTYDAGTDGLLPNVSVDVSCQYGYGGTVETDANGQYSLSGMPAGTCNISVDEADADIPDGSTLVEGNNPASVTLSGGGTAGERYGFERSDIWQGGTPSGEVFVHTYVPDLSIEEADYLADDLIHLDIQRWSGLAPIFRPDNLPELCLAGTSTCETGDVRTVRFVVEDTDGDGQAIENLTGKQPTFDYPNGREVVYTHDHAWGDTNYDDCEHLWILLLSKGGVTPDDGLASPTGCVQAIAETGYPGTYQVEGTLYLRAQWTGGISYEHDWDIPIEFYVTQRAPYPQSP
jgi:hypothetical protein